MCFRAIKNEAVNHHAKHDMYGLMHKWSFRVLFGEQNELRRQMWHMRYVNDFAQKKKCIAKCDTKRDFEDYDKEQIWC